MSLQSARDVTKRISKSAAKRGSEKARNRKIRLRADQELVFLDRQMVSCQDGASSNALHRSHAHTDHPHRDVRPLEKTGSQSEIPVPGAGKPPSIVPIFAAQVQGQNMNAVCASSPRHGGAVLPRPHRHEQGSCQSRRLPCGMQPDRGTGITTFCAEGRELWGREKRLLIPAVDSTWRNQRSYLREALWSVEACLRYGGLCSVIESGGKPPIWRALQRG